VLASEPYKKSAAGARCRAKAESRTRPPAGADSVLLHGGLGSPVTPSAGGTRRNVPGSARFQVALGSQLLVDRGHGNTQTPISPRAHAWTAAAHRPKGAISDCDLSLW
jgi:hypothetical protein